MTVLIHTGTARMLILKNIRRVQLFRERHGKYCRDLLFDNENGAHRILGQYRLYFDRIRRL